MTKSKDDLQTEELTGRFQGFFRQLQEMFRQSLPTVLQSRNSTGRSNKGKFMQNRRKELKRSHKRKIKSFY